MATDEANDGETWRSSSATTNYLLALLIVVTAAGFVSIDGGYGALGLVAELVLTLVLLSAIVLVVGMLVQNDAE